MPQLSSYFLSLSIILFFSLVGAFLSKKFKKPAFLSFILIGILVENFMPPGLVNKELFASLAGLGIVLLLLTIGLEMPLHKLFRSGKDTFYASLIQIFGNAVFIFLVVFLFFHDVTLAALLSFPLALSSTAIVGKLLQEQGEDTSLSGNITLGILIYQDLFSVVLILLISMLAREGGMFNTTLFIDLVKKIAIVGGIVYTTSHVMEFVFKKQHIKREELSILIFAMLFFFMWLFMRLELPETTAGFIIGVMLAHRVEQHEIFSQVRIFRDILLVLFFFFLGTYIQDLNLQMLILSFLFSVVLMFTKFVSSWIGLLVLGFHRKTSYTISFDLMQVGEFSFVVLSMLAATNFLPSAYYQFFLLVVIWSLLLFSLLYRQKHRIYSTVVKPFGNYFTMFERSIAIAKPQFDQLEYKDHIVLCGYGRVGSYVGHGLILSHLPIVVLDTNAVHIKKLQEKGIVAIYGDATEKDILDYAQVDTARFLIIAVPSFADQEKIIVQAKKLNPHIQIITRSHLNTYLRHLKILGIKFIFQPEFEAAVTILKKVLQIYRVDKSEIKKRIHYLKIEHGMGEQEGT